MQKIELLAPAGNMSKLKTVLYFGADAAYVGGKSFSLRSYADNFTEEELKEAVALTHGLNKKLYVTVNIFAKNADMEEAARYFKFLEEIGVDAALVTDPGFLSLAKEVAPGLTLHMSTQANTLNYRSAAFWHKMGVERVVLARELSLKEIAEIHEKNPTLELETFIHGAMCISYSGRCLLSNYFTNRDGNRGECVQACRWNYTLREKTVEDRAPLEVEQDERGTYFMNSKDLCLVEHIPDMANAGVVSFKIEGRMKSEYYIATVVNAYRRAIDEYYAKGKVENIDFYLAELKKIAHRDYTKAYLLGANDATVSYHDGQKNGDAIFAAYVLDYSDGVATIEMRNRMRTGDKLEILSPSASFNKIIEVKNMTDRDGNAVTDAKLVQQVLKLPTDYPLAKGDILRLVAEN